MTQFFKESRPDQSPASQRRVMINRKKKELKDIQRYYQKAMGLVHHFEEKIKQKKETINQLDSLLSKTTEPDQKTDLLALRKTHENYIEDTLKKINPNIEKLTIVASRIEILQTELDALKQHPIESTPGA